jgi:hypothetical protein
MSEIDYTVFESNPKSEVIRTNRGWALGRILDYWEQKAVIIKTDGCEGGRLCYRETIAWERQPYLTCQPLIHIFQPSCHGKLPPKGKVFSRAEYVLIQPASPPFLTFYTIDGLDDQCLHMLSPLHPAHHSLPRNATDAKDRDTQVNGDTAYNS